MHQSLPTQRLLCAEPSPPPSDVTSSGPTQDLPSEIRICTRCRARRVPVQVPGPPLEVQRGEKGKRGREEQTETSWCLWAHRSTETHVTTGEVSPSTFP